MWRVRGTLEPLGQPGQESGARAELRIADADAGAVADLVDLVEQVENVEAQLEALVQSGVNRLHNAEVHLLVARQAVPVRAPVRVAGPEAAAGGKVGGEKSTGRRHSVLDAGRIRVGLIVIEMDVVAGNECELIGAEIELRRGYALAEGLRRGEVSVKRPVPDLIAEKRFDTFDDPVVIIEGCQEDLRTELPLVKEGVGELVIDVDPGLEPG